VRKNFRQFGLLPIAMVTRYSTASFHSSLSVSLEQRQHLMSRIAVLPSECAMHWTCAVPIATLSARQFGLRAGGDTPIPWTDFDYIWRCLLYIHATTTANVSSSCRHSVMRYGCPPTPRAHARTYTHKTFNYVAEDTCTDVTTNAKHITNNGIPKWLYSAQKQNQWQCVGTTYRE
jgi:hypothetical protein